MKKIPAAVAHQTHQVQRGIVGLAVFNGLHERFVGEKVAVVDRLGNAGQLLIDHAAGADVGVTDLAVAHLPVRQTDVQTRRADIGEGILGKELV